MRFNAVLYRHKGLILSVIVFLLVAFALTFKVISLPTIVIGDNFNWTPQNLVDITGPKVIRESYMGDLAVLSAFKTGFLFPLTYSVVSLNLPSTIVYPFLFYFLSMLSFYFLAKEFLKSTLLTILISVLYVVNPVTPYYFASLINAFSLVLLPLGLKFFVRTLREAQKSSKHWLVLKNLALTAFFLSLAVSANEQFILSIVLVATIMVATLAVVQFRNRLNLAGFGKSFLFNLIVIASIFCIVNGPLFLSIVNVQKAAWSTYFQGPSVARFFATIDYSYGSADFATLLRFGGDSSTGLGQSSWYDSNILTNVFGYTLFFLFVASAVLLFLKKENLKTDRTFFTYTAVLFAVTFALILLVKCLTLLGPAGSSFDSLLKTWENPGKLRVVLLISALTTSLVVFSKLETSAQTTRNKVLTYSLLLLVALSTIAYNSPWLIDYPGQTTLQGISDASHWNGLYQKELSKVNTALDYQGSDQRKIILPYTHATELYASPQSRVFQMVSQVNELTSQLIPEDNNQWSKTLGLFSIKAVALQNNYYSSDMLIFPSSANINETLFKIKNSAGFSEVSQVGDYQLLSNNNALPMLYASSHYVYYDYIGTLKYVFNYVNFDDLPVFLSSTQQGGLALPTYAASDNYTLYALTLQQTADSPILHLNINNNSETVRLEKQNNYQNLSVYSKSVNLNAGDFVSVPSSPDIHLECLDDITLSSNSSMLGRYGSFALDFSVNILQNGNYNFLGPRIILDTGDKQYFIIIHDNGMIELATLENDVFSSAIATSYIGYSLKEPQNQIDIKVVKHLDEVKIYVDGVLSMTFITEPKYVDLFFTSEKSTSLFSNVTLAEQSSTRLFAIRQNSVNPSFVVHKNSAEQSELTVFSNTSDFMVVSQYLDTQLSKIEDRNPSAVASANVLFKSWLFDFENSSDGIHISITTENLYTSFGLTAFSIVSCYITLLLVILPFRVKVKLRKVFIKKKTGDQ